MKNRGYGLVEILVVIGIIAILSTLAIGLTGPAREKGRMAENIYQGATDISGLGLCSVFGDDSEKCTKSESTCTELGWGNNSPNKGDRTRSNVFADCGESDVSYQGVTCHSGKTCRIQ